MILWLLTRKSGYGLVVPQSNPSERMKPRKLACAVWIVGLLSVPVTVWAQSETTAKVQGADLLPPTIPIFPLPDVMLFPNVSRPLHIFEPRYRAMVADALQGDRIIGMVLLRPGYEADYEGRPPVYPIGCAGVITQSQELPDGRYNIMLRGLVKFRITGEDRVKWLQSVISNDILPLSTGQGTYSAFLSREYGWNYVC